MADPNTNQQNPLLCPQPFLQSGIKDGFKKIKRANSRASLRSFARRLGVSHSAISEILNGKRKVSKEKAVSFADALKISGDARKTFLNDFNEVDPEYEILPEEVFQVLADPDYFHVLTLVDTFDFNPEPRWIASRLGITEKKAAQVFQTLEAFKLIAQDETGGWVPTNNRVATNSDKASQAIRKSHEQSLLQAKETLHNVPMDQRFFLSATMPTDAEKYNLAIAMLKDTLNRISELFETSGKEEVYKLQIALYPVTKIKKSQEKEC